MNDINNNAVKSNKKAKKKLLIIIICILTVMILLVIASLIIDLIENNKNKEYEIDYNFYPADYEENIFEDEKYILLTKDGFISYCDSSTNITLGIDKEIAKNYGEEVDFLVDMIYDIINGDHESYNEKFSDSYYKNNSPKNSFTMQKVYDVKITSISDEEVAEEAGNYTKSVYCVEYKIYHNNGTFRRDIGDGSKKQYITLTNASGELLIDSISTVIISKK
ncbi:MAG: hypothetical protein IJZ83_09235 [Clostridia bacterium]|nr:hypothetical protein [Clostridia bacterium]